MKQPTILKNKKRTKQVAHEKYRLPADAHKYLFLLKKPSIKSTTAAARKIRKLNIPVLFQFGSIGLEVYCTRDSAVILFDTGAFSLKTATAISTENQTHLSTAQISIVEIWNAQFNPKYKYQKKERLQKEIKGWGDEKYQEPAPYLPFNLKRFENRLLALLKKKGKSLQAIEKALRINTKVWRPNLYSKVEQYFSTHFKDKQLATAAAQLYHHASPAIRNIMLGSNIVDLVEQVISELNTTDGCWKMHGRNSVAVVFVESEKPKGPKFKQYAKTSITNEIISGLSWLVEEHPAGNLTWVMDIQQVQIAVPDQPNLKAWDPNYDAYWREAAMGKIKLGKQEYEAEDEAMSIFRNNLITRDQSEHAFIIFVTPYGSSWHAYSTGKDFICLSENGSNWGGWGINALDRITAHETCHKYGAVDEYIKSGTPCSHCSGEHGCDRIPNGNCESCIAPGEPCIMRNNRWKLCQYTRAQIGWSDLFVELYTDQSIWSGTNSKVWLDIGEKSYALEILNHDDRERGNREGYALWDNGILNKSDVKRLILKKSKSIIGGGWKLARIKVFQGGGLICDEHPATWIENDQLFHLVKSYNQDFINALTIEVTTADEQWAGTNDDITLRLNNATQVWELDNAGNDFQRGAKNIFNLYPGPGMLVKDLKSFTINKSADGIAGGWKIGKIVLRVNGKIIYAKDNINKWLKGKKRSFSAKILIS